MARKGDNNPTIMNKYNIEVFKVKADFRCLTSTGAWI